MSTYISKAMDHNYECSVTGYQVPIMSACALRTSDLSKDSNIIRLFNEINDAISSLEFQLEALGLQNFHKHRALVENTTINPYFCAFKHLIVYFWFRYQDKRQLKIWREEIQEESMSVQSVIKFCEIIQQPLKSGSKVNPIQVFGDGAKKDANEKANEELDEPWETPIITLVETAMKKRSLSN